MTMWLVATTEGNHPRVVHADSERKAILARFDDQEDNLPFGNVAVWRLGHFPLQFEIDGRELRLLGRPQVGG